MAPRRGGRTDPHTLVGAYAMDAVTEAEGLAFEHHLAGCESCRSEVRGLREATARLAAATAVRPRAELREQTVLAASKLSQLPPALTPDRSRRRWLPVTALAAAAALAIAAGVLGAGMSGADHQLRMDRQHSHAMAAVLTAPDAIMLTAKVRTGGTATVVMSHADRALVFTAAGLPALAAGRSYELWLMGPSGPVSAGMIHAARHDGMAGPMVVSGLAPGDRISLTVEPAGGSARPTSAPVVMLGTGRAGS